MNLELKEGYNGITDGEELRAYMDNMKYKDKFEAILKTNLSEIDINEIKYIMFGETMPSDVTANANTVWWVGIGDYINIYLYNHDIYVEALTKDSFEHYKEIAEMCEANPNYFNDFKKINNNAGTIEAPNNDNTATIETPPDNGNNITFRTVPVFEEYDQGVDFTLDFFKRNPDTYNPNIEMCYLQRETPLVKVRYHKELCPELIELKKDPLGDFIDLRSAENVELSVGEYKLISLGISVQLPKGYHAEIVPRSSTYKNFGIIMSNSIGIIDESYCGDDDIWHFPAIALKSTKININDRICQFRIVKNRDINIELVDRLDNENRGGIGSTGKN